VSSQLSWLVLSLYAASNPFPKNALADLCETMRSTALSSQSSLPVTVRYHYLEFLLCVLICMPVQIEMSLAQGFVQLGAGLSVGLAGLAAGFAIGIVGDAGVRGTAQQPRLFVGMVRAKCNKILSSAIGIDENWLL
jgi:F0F1-type ATP synthase membrane subunit c/vacuolar-type H+-ATPase subunit K